MAGGHNWYGELLRAQAENLASDPSPGLRGRIFFDTVKLRPRFDTGAAIRDFMDSLESLSADPSPNRAGRVFWNTALGKARIDTGVVIQDLGGSNAAGINYITNPDAEAGTTGWAAYADAAGTAPVDGTGGSPTAAISRVTSSPIRGTGMFRLTKDAANRQGQGVSYDFTIAAADKAKALTVSFEYQVSAAFVSGDSSDVRVWIYDVTNSVLIPVTPYTIQGGTGLPYKFAGTFQTNSNSTSYRLIIHIATTNASAWTFDFDNVVVAPQQLVLGSPVTDWKSFTPTGTWTTNTTYSGFWRRVGDVMEIQYQLNLAGSPDAVALTLNLPSGYSVDTAKLAAFTGTSGYNIIGHGIFFDASGTTGHTMYAIVTAGKIAPGFNASTTGEASGADVTNSAPIGTIQNGDRLTLTAAVPIQGWGSSVEMSSDNDGGRLVSAKLQRASSSQSISDNTSTKVQFNSIVTDSHGAFDSSTNYRYTVPVSGKYRLHGSLCFAATSGTGACYALLKKNGSDVSYFHGPKTGNANVTWAIPYTFQDTAVAGDYYEIFVFQNTGGSVNLVETGTVIGGTTLNIERLPGASTVATTETVSAKYTANANGSAPSSATVFNYDTKVWDTHGAVATGSDWAFTAPVSGRYAVRASIGINGAVVQGTTITCYANGVATEDGVAVRPVTVNYNLQPMVHTVVRLLAGQTIQIKNSTDVVTSTVFSGGPSQQFICIDRIGNY